MIKILSIDQSQIMSGLAIGDYMQNTGLWSSAPGLNPFIESTSLRGLIAGSSAPTDITGSTVVDTPIAGKTRVTGSGTGSLYILGSSGHLYSIDISGDNNPSDLRSGTPISNPANGLEIFKPNGGTEYLYYWQTGQIGRWNLSGSYPTGWTDNWSTSLESTAYHPTHQFLEAVWYGNKDRIGCLSGSSPTNTLNALDFPSDFLVTDLTDDGTYLVASITKNLGDNVMLAENRIIFWDTFSSSWQREWYIQDSAINTIYSRYGNIFVVGGRGLWMCNFVSPPTLIRPLTSSNNVSYGYANAIAGMGDGIIFGNQLTSYGKIIPEAPRAFFTPYAGHTGDVSLIVKDGRVNRMWVGTATPKLYRYNTATNGTASQFSTIFIDLKRRFKIKQLDFIIPNGLGSGDVVAVVGQSPETNTTFVPVSYANFGGVYRVKTVPNSSGHALETELLQLKLTISGGTPSIKRIDIWGEAVEDE